MTPDELNRPNNCDGCGTRPAEVRVLVAVSAPRPHVVEGAVCRSCCTLVVATAGRWGDLVTLLALS